MMQVWRRVAHFFYGLYACVAFLTVALPALALIVSLPGLANRRRMARHSARLAFRMMGVPINVRNIESVPDAGCVVVANHASYLDGVILTAVLPANFSFVIKQEVRRVPVAHLMLRRLGSHFVERFDRHRSAVDTRRILRAASAGQALAFFPEGTFEPEPGLRAFRSGAFATAVRAGLPVLPVAIRGSREILPASAVLPRPGRLEIEILELLEADTAEAGNPAIALKRRVRQRILAAIDEPDLVSPTVDPDASRVPTPGAGH